MQENFVERCLADGKINTLIVRCAHNDVTVAHLHYALNQAKTARDLCVRLLAVGKTGTHATTPLHTLFENGDALVLEWLINVMPLDLLSRHRCAESNNSTVLHVLAARQRKTPLGSVDPVVDVFIPRFFESQARAESLEVLDGSGTTPLEYLSASNNFVAYRAVQDARNSLGASGRANADQMMLERTRHDLERAVDRGETLRVRVETAEQTTAMLQKRYVQLETTISERTNKNDELRRRLADLSADRNELELRTQLLKKAQGDAKAAAAETAKLRKENERALRKDHEERTKLIQRSANSEKIAAEMAQRVIHLESVVRDSDKRLDIEAAANERNAAARFELEQQLIASDSRNDQSAEQKAAERIEIDAKLAVLTRSRDELSKRYAEAEEKHKRARSAVKEMTSDHTKAVAASATLRAELEASAVKTLALEERLEQLSAAQSEEERRGAALRVELAAVRAEQEQRNAVHEAQAAALRRANETLAVEVDEARRTHAATCEQAERENKEASAALALALQRAAEENARATEAAEQLASTAARNAELERVATEYCEQVTSLDSQSRQREEEMRQRLRDMQERIDASERAVADTQSGMAARLEVAEQKLSEARRSAHDEKAASRELTDRVAVLSANASPTLPTRMLSPRVGLKRAPSGSSKKPRPGDVVDETPEEPTTPRGLTPRGRTLLRRTSTIRPMGRAPMPALAARDAGIAAIAQLVAEDDEPLALATYKVNEQLWQGMREAMARADIAHMSDLFRLGLSANTRDPATHRDAARDGSARLVRHRVEPGQTGRRCQAGCRASRQAGRVDHQSRRRVGRRRRVHSAAREQSAHATGRAAQAAAARRHCAILLRAAHGRLGQGGEDDTARQRHQSRAVARDCNAVHLPAQRRRQRTRTHCLSLGRSSRRRHGARRARAHTAASGADGKV